MKLFTVVYDDMFVTNVWAKSESDAIRQAENCSHWKTMQYLDTELIEVSKDKNHIDEELDCPQCGAKIFYITPNVQKCPTCNYFNINCPECGSSGFDGYCWNCKHKAEGYRDMDTSKRDSNPKLPE